ncbi:MAG: rSAM-modified peptide [Prevotellaceae bacterium]|jgi:hypothetical protein|nr:rSAM-modified peptide [Prevotellaceae bacterium]
MKFSELKNSSNILSSNEMKNIKGGSGTCGYLGPVIAGKSTVRCNISKEDALFWYGDGGNGAHWCCDSCKNTWYCGSVSIKED